MLRNFAITCDPEPPDLERDPPINSRNSILYTVAPTAANARGNAEPRVAEEPSKLVLKYSGGYTKSPPLDPFDAKL